MPYLVSTSFDRFLERISISTALYETATMRSTRVAELLSESLTILDAFPTGSLVRNTAIRNKSDVDVMAVIHYSKHLDGKSPRQTLEMVRLALADYNARIVKKNGQAVTLYFKTWPSVDIVPTMRMKDGTLRIPDMTSGTWIATNPRDHDALVESLPEWKRDLMRIVKFWNHAHSGYFQSFHIERIAAELSIEPFSRWREDGWPWALFQFFEKAIERLQYWASMSNEYDPDDRLELVSRLERGRELADEAWYSAYKGRSEDAIDRLRVLLTNDFPAYG